MTHRPKIHGFACAAAMCVALAATSGIAQENAHKAGSDRDASRGDGAGTGTIRGGSDSRGSDTGPGGDGAAVQNRLHDGDTGPVGIQLGPDRQGSDLGPDAGRKGTPSSTPGSKSVALDHGINLISADDGYAGLHRRAIRKTLIANATKKPAGLLAGTVTTPQFTRHGPDGGAVHNALGTVVPASNGVGEPGAGHHVPGFMAHAGAGASGPGVTGTSAIGTNITGTGGVRIHRPTILLGTVAGPTVHVAGVNGTTMGHIVSGPGSVGGPAKDRSGINGTTLRPK